MLIRHISCSVATLSRPNPPKVVWLNENTSDDTNFSTDLSEEGDTDKVIHDKSGKVLREIGAGHKIKYIVHDFTGLNK